MALEKPRAKRLTLDLSPRFYSRLEELETIVEAESKSSLIRDALQVYEYVVKRTLEGYRFKAFTKDGKEEVIRFVGIDAPDEPNVGGGRRDEQDTGAPERA